MNKIGIAILLALTAAVFLPNAGAAYNVTHLNVTVMLNATTTAHVTEVYTVSLTGASISQYQTNRQALNLTLSDWQELLGPVLVQHLINPTRGITNFYFLPSAVSVTPRGNTAFILLSYDVPNATTVKHISPRLFSYSFNSKVFNFAPSVSGESLTQNTTLSIVLPQQSTITTIFPLPDSPVYASARGYANSSTVSWDSGEPLSAFSLSYTLTQSPQAEVEAFFYYMYHKLGVSIYLIVTIIVGMFIIYAYYKAIR